MHGTKVKKINLLLSFT